MTPRPRKTAERRWPAPGNDYSARNQPARESLLLHHVLELKRVGHDSLAGADAANDFLHVAGKHLSRSDLHPPELPIFCGHVNPVAIVQMQYRSRRNRSALFRFLPMKGGSNKHAHAHE